MVSGEVMTGLVSAGLATTFISVFVQALLICISVVRSHPKTGRLAFENPIYWIFGGGGPFPAITFFCASIVMGLMSANLAFSIALYFAANGYNAEGIIYRAVSLILWGGCLIWVFFDLRRRGERKVSRNVVATTSVGLLVAFVFVFGLMAPIAKSKIIFDPRLSAYTQGVANL